MTADIEAWLKPGAGVPVNIKTVGLLVQEIHRLRAIVPKATEDRPISEIFAEVGEEWAQAKKRASILEDTRSAYRSQMIMRRLAQDSKIALNRAEAEVLASKDWTDKIQEIVDAKYEENHLWVKMESLRMAHSEWQSHEANERLVAKL